MKYFLLICVVLVLVKKSSAAGANAKFVPYYDASLKGKTNLTDIVRKTGQKDFHLAFAVGGYQGCKPTWGGEFAIDDPEVINPIKEIQAQGGTMILATGGALGPYLESICSSSDALATAYKLALDTVGTNHLDLDIEATVSFDMMNIALAQIQKERPAVTVSFTLMVQGEDYGLTPFLGVELLNNAVKNGVRVDIVNAMAMEYNRISPTMGESVINVGKAVLAQMKGIWPEKSETDLKKMLGITPMIGRNFNSNKFETSDANKLVDWANQNEIGLLAFWSIERDKGGCEGSLSPYCSGVSQQEFEFTKKFQGFKGTNNFV